jgi:c-di-GMP-binding flagellar brake protein YcgR
MNSEKDRRSAKRIAASVSVQIRSSGTEVSAETRDISQSGIFLYTKSPIAEGSNVELVLILPPELTSGEQCWVCCHARILRVQEEPGKRFGAAAQIERMDILPEIPA